MIDGRKLKELREQADLTTTQLAEDVGVSQSMISHMERGFKAPSLEVVVRIASRLGVTVDELIHSDPGANKQGTA